MCFMVNCVEFVVPMFHLKLHIYDSDKWVLVKEEQSMATKIVVM